MTGGPGWRLAMAAREPDQAGRLLRFRDAHPETRITPGEFGEIHAWIPAAGGDRSAGREIVGRTLRELLDKLERAFRPARENSRSSTSPPWVPPGTAGKDPPG